MMSAPIRSPVDGRPVLRVVARADAPPLEPPTVAAAGYAMGSEPEPDADITPVRWAEVALLLCAAASAVVMGLIAWLAMEMLR